MLRTLGSKLSKSFITYRSFACVNKLVSSPQEAIKDMKDGVTVAMGGFGIVGIPENGVLAMVEKKVKNVHIVSNVAGVKDWGLGLLMDDHQILEMNASYVGENPTFEKQYLKGEIGLNLIPQGTLAERCRMGNAGIAAAYVKAGVGTYVEFGQFPVRSGKDGKSILKVTKPRERREFDGRNYLLEEAIRVDYSMIKVYQADKKGNCRFRKVMRNFNPDMAGAGRINIAEAEHIVDEIPVDKIHLPGCYIDRVYKSPKVSHKIERLRIRKPNGAEKKASDKAPKKEESKDSRRERIAARAVYELDEGMYCNLGIGIPTMVSNAIIGKKDVDLQSEDGLCGCGPYPLENEIDSDIINAGKETITEAIGHCHNRSSDAFGMMRGVHLHATMLGSLEISETGDIANWIIPGQKVKGMGGAMDLVSCGSKVICVMEHVGPGGVAKLLPKCNIPLTGKGCVSKLITDMGVFEFGEEGCVLTEIAPDTTLEELKKVTKANYKVSPKLKKMKIE